jgi:hypothetical protein
VSTAATTTTAAATTMPTTSAATALLLLRTRRRRWDGRGLLRRLFSSGCCRSCGLVGFGRLLCLLFSHGFLDSV